MDIRHSVTSWIDGLKSGKDEAAARLWDRYFEQIVSVARCQLAKFPIRVADAEDVAVSVFASLCEGASAGRFDRVANRRDLWSLLIALTHRKSIDLIRWDGAQKRGNGKVAAASENPATSLSLRDLVSRDPTPHDLARMEDQYRHLIDLLDADSRRVAALRMEGHAVEEIAEQIERSISFVERKLRLVRTVWEREFERD